MSRYARLRLACAGLMLCLAGASPAYAAPHQVVVLYDERIDLPGLSLLHASLTRRLTSGPPGSVEIYREEMDLSRFGSDGYLLHLRDRLRTKYAGMKIDVAVAAYPPALDFLLTHGDAVFPGAPIVFCGIDRRMFGARALPPHVTGALVKREFAPTLELALRLHPDTERAVFVAGTSAFDTQLVDQARKELGVFEDRLALTYLTTLPLRELLTRLSQLPPRTIVLYSAVFRDGAGEHFVPHDVAERVSAAANAPVYGFLDQYLGRGIVGGQLYSLDAHGEEAANLALQILAGTAPSQLPLVEPRASLTMFDWRQLQRWGLSESELPAGAIIRFREPSVWREYRLYVLGAAAIVALQALMIGSLLLQRARRRRAEHAVHRHQVELAHAGRLATMGELTATIAHEVNQPLGAILANVAAAEILLESGGSRLEDVRQILADVRKDDLRASEVIRRLRTLLAKHEMARERLDLNATITEVLNVLGAEAGRRQVELATEFDPALPRVLGDRVHLQQVLLNLVVNAMDAMADTHASLRRVVVRTDLRQNGSVEVAVTDSGHGVSREDLSKLFESFFTTKQRGMGLGLSIARSIVQAHGGQIWAESDARGGATFRFTLPVAEGAAPQPTSAWGQAASGARGRHPGRPAAP
jgi:signal transduction histidine kinase